MVNGAIENRSQRLGLVRARLMQRRPIATAARRSGCSRALLRALYRRVWRAGKRGAPAVEGTPKKVAVVTAPLPLRRVLNKKRCGVFKIHQSLNKVRSSFFHSAPERTSLMMGISIAAGAAAMWL